VTATRIAIEEKISQLPSEYANDLYCQEVLIFLRRHPYTRFSQLAIVHALNSHRLYVEQALNHLTNSGVIRSYLKNNVPFYSLKEQV
jgi:hypothetical protein